MMQSWDGPTDTIKPIRIRLINGIAAPNVTAEIGADFEYLLDWYRLKSAAAFTQLISVPATKMEVVGRKLPNPV